MAYQQNIPQASQRLKDSQADLLGNFQAIKQLIDVNHDTFGSASEGKHKFVSFPDQGSSPTVAADEIALFGRLSTLSNASELCVRKESNGAVYEFTSAGATSNGWARLPSGILLKWGSGTATGLSGAISFPSGATIPAFSTGLIMFVVPAYTLSSDGNGFVRLNSFTAPWTSFTVYASQRTTTNTQAVAFNYLAIGI